MRKYIIKHRSWKYGINQILDASLLHDVIDELLNYDEYKF